MNASEAYEAAKKYREEQRLVEIKELESLIESFARKGFFKVNLKHKISCYNLTLEDWQSFQDRGFSVTNNDGLFDMKNWCATDISWEPKE